MTEKTKPKPPLDVKEAACHNCGEICKIKWDKRVNCYVSECHGVGFDYEDSRGVHSESNELRYVSDWNE